MNDKYEESIIGFKEWFHTHGGEKHNKGGYESSKDTRLTHWLVPRVVAPEKIGRSGSVLSKEQGNYHA